MKKYWAITRKPVVEQYENALQAARSMLDAVNESLKDGGIVHGRKASANRRFAVLEDTLGGEHRTMGRFAGYKVAGYSFALFDSGIVDTWLTFRQDTRTIEGTMPYDEAIVYGYVLKKYGVRLDEYVRAVLNDFWAVKAA